MTGRKLGWTASVTTIGLVILNGCTGHVELGGKFLPRHSGSNEGPSGLAEGTLVEVSGCYRLNGYLLVWPDSYSLTSNSDGVAISGEGRELRSGQYVAVAGGEVDAANLPAASSALEIPCSGPYLWVTEVSRVGQ